MGNIDIICTIIGLVSVIVIICVRGLKLTVDEHCNCLSDIIFSSTMIVAIGIMLLIVLKVLPVGIPKIVGALILLLLATYSLWKLLFPKGFRR